MDWQVSVLAGKAVAVNLCWLSAAKKPHYGAGFMANQIEDGGQACLTVGAKSIHRAAAKHDKIRAHRNGLDDMLAITHTAIKNQRHVRADRLSDLAKRVYGRGGGIELSATMVGHIDCLYAQRFYADCVFRALHTLDHQLSRPAVPQSRKKGPVGPCPAGIANKAGFGAGRGIVHWAWHAIAKGVGECRKRPMRM